MENTDKHEQAENQREPGSNSKHQAYHHGRGNCCHDEEQAHHHRRGHCCHDEEQAHHHEHGHCCHDLGHDHDGLEEEGFEEDPIIQIVDEETGETYDFYVGDEFEYENQLYYVLVPVEEEPSVFVIGKVTLEDDEAFIETLTEEENDIIYDVYDQILEDYFSDDSETKED